MEFIEANLIQTTTSITVDSNTATAENLFDRDTTFQYFTSGFNNDLTTASITLSLTASTNISRMAIMGHNLKAFTIFYNGVTANTFSFTSTADTTTSDYSSNSQTSIYLTFATQAVSSVTIDMKSTIVADSEKAIGYFYMGDTKLVFPRIPNAQSYSPSYNSKEVVHKMSDGGTRLHYIDTKFQASIKFKYIEQSFRDDLYTLWKEKTSFVFVPWGTHTGWDGILHEVIWPGSFDFFKYSDNAAASGFTGKIGLYEVT